MFGEEITNFGWAAIVMLGITVSAVGFMFYWLNKKTNQLYRALTGENENEGENHE